MIKYYTYYSCGGYKDIYIGSDQDSADASYFIPLLNVWKKSNKPENVDKVARAKSVQHVELISKSNSAGFPSECNLMFSHGGYKAILRTLKDGRLCLSIRDISNGAKDEEGRDIPFNFLFLADGQESIYQLDALAIEYLTQEKDINELISNTISYDPVINGIRFDLLKLNQLLSNQHETSKSLLHKAGIIDYLKISSRNQYKLSLSEQALDANIVNSFWDDNGLFYGEISYNGESTESAGEENFEVLDIDKKEDTPLDSQVDTEKVDECLVSTPITSQNEEENPVETNETSKNKSDRTNNISESNIESLIQQIDKKVSLLATSGAVDNLQSLLMKLSNESNAILNSIQEKPDNQNATASTYQLTSIERSDELPLMKKPVVIAVGCLIVGFILGALIF